MSVRREVSIKISYIMHSRIKLTQVTVARDTRKGKEQRLGDLGLKIYGAPE